MPQLVLLVLQLVAGQLSLAEAVAQVYALLSATATFQQAETIRGSVQKQELAAFSVVYGFEALHDDIAAIAPPSGPTIQDVLDAIAALPAGSDIVIPPAGPDAAGIWAYVNGATPAPGTASVGAQLAEAWGVLHEMYWQQALLVNGNPVFTVESPGGSIVNLSSQFTSPRPDFTDILPGESVVDWLNRTDANHWTWEYDDRSGLAVSYDAPSGENWYAMRCMLRSLTTAPTGALGAPIWPGQAGVTDGEPTVLTETGIVTAPMDGIKLTVDSGPGGAGQWGVGDFRSYYRAGYVVFLDADGHADTTQFVGPDDNIFAPKGMTTAASVVVGLNKATQITVTPWTLGAPPS